MLVFTVSTIIFQIVLNIFTLDVKIHRKTDMIIGVYNICHTLVFLRIIKLYLLKIYMSKDWRAGIRLKTFVLYSV